MRRKVTEAKKRRAIDAIVALIECDDFPDKGNGTCWELERACDLIRELQASR